MKLVLIIKAGAGGLGSVVAVRTTRVSAPDTITRGGDTYTLLEQGPNVWIYVSGALVEV